MGQYTNDKLITTIKSKILMPSSQVTYSEADILTIADEELQVGIVPLIMTCRDDYFVVAQDQPIGSGPFEYRIPTRAIGTKLKDVVMVDSNNKEYSIPLISSSTAPYRSNIFKTYQGLVCFCRNNFLVLQGVAASAPGNMVRLYYFLRRNKLVPITEGARIDSIDTVNKQVIVSLLPNTITLTTLVDIIQAQPAFDILAMDQTITNINGLILTFSTLPTALAIGDFICLAGESVVPQVPVEFHPVLAQRVAVKLLEALGDAAGSQLARTKLQEMEKSTLGMLSQRVEGEAKKIINYFSTLDPSNRFRGFGIAFAGLAGYVAYLLDMLK